MRRIVTIIALILSILMLGCVSERPKGYNEPGYPDSYFEHPKLGWMLNKTYYIYETQGIDAAVAYVSNDPNNIVENNSIKVWISITEENKTYVDTMQSMGINILYVLNSTDISRGISAHAFLPIPKIHEVGELKFVKYVSFSVKPILT